MKAGKKPFFLKKSAKRRAELVAKYEELKGSGNYDVVDNFLLATYYCCSCSGTCRVRAVRAHQALSECPAAVH